jgi:hypothetical protein
MVKFLLENLKGLSSSGGSSSEKKPIMLISHCIL